MLTPCFLILFPLPTAVIMLISTALLLDSNIRNSVCTLAVPGGRGFVLYILHYILWWVHFILHSLGKMIHFVAVY
jgi:hypothetical protein